MIPKIIHYCWVGPNPQPLIVKQCIESWHRVMPDYEVRLWNERNIPIYEHKFMKQAYERKIFAFVSDYARYWVLKQYGGFFLDTDVEALKSFDALSGNEVFFAFQKHVKRGTFFVAPGLIMGAEKGSEVISEILGRYDNIDLVGEDQCFNFHFSSPRVLTKYLTETRGLKIEDSLQSLSGGIVVYPSEYFDPVNPRILFGNRLQITRNTYSVHHGVASWVSKKKKMKMYMSIISRNIFGDKLIEKIRGKEKI